MNWTVPRCCVHGKMFCKLGWPRANGCDSLAKKWRQSDTDDDFVPATPTRECAPHRADLSAFSARSCETCPSTQFWTWQHHKSASERELVIAELRNDDTIQITTRRPPVWRERTLASLSSALPNCASQRHELLFVPRVDHHVPSGQPQTPLSALPLGRMSAGSGTFLGQDSSASSQVYYRRCYRTLPRHCAMMRWPPVLLHFSVLLLHQLASY